MFILTSLVFTQLLRHHAPWHLFSTLQFVFSLYKYVDNVLCKDDRK